MVYGVVRRIERRKGGRRTALPSGLSGVATHGRSRGPTFCRNEPRPGPATNDGQGRGLSTLSIVEVFRFATTTRAEIYTIKVDRGEVKIALESADMAAPISIRLR